MSALETQAGAQPPRSFRWGESYRLETDIRTRVLAERIQWFIQIRWSMVGLCVIAMLLSLVGLLPSGIDPRFIVGVGAFLTASNLVYTFVTTRFPRKHRVMVAQVLTDYATLSVLTYATGSMETPVPVFYIAHVILASLFFSGRVSLFLTGIALLFALLPLSLELTGVLPLRSLHDLSLKTRLISDPILPLVYGGVLGACYFFCWYLTSTITGNLKLRERQLEESHRMMEQIDREKTQATLRATHELKAPFAVIKSYVYSLRDGFFGEVPEEAMQVINRIGDRCDRLTNMITVIIHVANLRTTLATEDDFELVDLRLFLAPEIEEAMVLGRMRAITIKAEISEEGPLVVRASTRHLHTLVSNLLRNAVTYSHDGGVITVALHAAKRNVALRIADQGIGIASENIPKIFDDFFRSNEAARVNPNGNGLGLALVKEVAKLHGATIEVASEVGKGTCFWVWFSRIPISTQGGLHGQDPDHR